MYRLTKEQIAEDIKLVFEQINKIPTSKHYDKLGQYARTTIKNRFGSWANAIKEIFNTDVSRHYRKLHPCHLCEKPTLNPKFCSSRCCAIHTNVHCPKRKPKGYCRVCNDPIASRKKYCEKCITNKPETNKISLESLGKIAIKEFHYKYKYQIYARIREHARTKYRESSLPKYCVKCGYDKHYEVCHIKPIRSFPKETIVNDINQLSNLISLCRNCHWELDHNLWEINSTALISIVA